MSIFSKKSVQLLPHPQVYFERLCEEEFGFNFTDHSIYEYEGNDLNKRLSNVWSVIRKAYPGKTMQLDKVGFGNLKIGPVDMFCLPDDYWDDSSNYKFIAI